MELKKCPFCGGEARLDIDYIGYGMNAACVKCTQCGAKGERFNVTASQCANDKATEAWNRRINDG